MPGRAATASTCRSCGSSSPSRCGARDGAQSSRSARRPDMQILFVISGLGLGGAEKQLVELAKELVRQRHTVAIYTLNRHVPRRAELEGSGVTLVTDQKRIRLDPAVLKRLRATMVRLRPDIVHGFLFDGDLYSRLAAL